MSHAGGEMIRMRIWQLALAVAVAMGGTAGITLACTASSPQPVYVCQDYTSCANGQFLEVDDHNGAPIFAVGQTGGAKTFGDCTSEYGPSDIFNAAVTLCYHAPSGSCKAPSAWLSPQGLYFCTGSTWMRRI